MDVAYSERLKEHMRRRGLAHIAIETHTGSS